MLWVVLCVDDVADIAVIDAGGAVIAVCGVVDVVIVVGVYVVVCCVVCCGNVYVVGVIDVGVTDIYVIVDVYGGVGVVGGLCCYCCWLVRRRCWSWCWW